MDKQLSKEEWKDGVGYETVFKVSKSGLVMMYSRTWKSGRWVVRTIPERLATFYIDKRGYQVFRIRVNSKTVNLKVHRVVAKAFVSNPKNKPQVNHKNGIKTDNRARNLEWATRAENMQHAKINKLMKPVMGEKHGGSKLKEYQVIEIRNSNLSSYKLAEKYGVARSTIEGIVNRRRWKHIA